ncbi:hypothetical protein PENTCL1PPCAC_27592 [Pristionchus entomophagus]|uniref:Uncharacterized protein n=1 Tax=Pristionchus entomophagus TaxID=358040 RepID=A0AAV5UFE2_9BILA|nr:hypothetical protein PENTCL1PPCAC_27592 [Pristionchus entomophagus]
MSGAEAHPPPPPPPPHGGNPHPHPMQGEWIQYSRGPYGQHYYTYMHQYKRCGGRWGTGFIVGGLVGMWAATCWQRRQCHNDAVDSCHWSNRGYWGWRKDQHQIEKSTKPEDVTNQ